MTNIHNNVTTLLSILVTIPLVLANSPHVNTRCSCKCPEAEVVDPDINPVWPGRKIYINSSVEPVDCDCEHVVVPVLGLDQEQIDKFCPRCSCVHEARSVVTIKVVVIIILWVLSVLLLYLMFLVCIDPLLGGRGVRPLIRASSTPYRQHQNEESINDDSVVEEVPDVDGSLSMSHYNGGARGVVNRLGDNQERWRRQVEIQRSSVYDRHTILN